MGSAIDGAAFVIGTLVLFTLSTIGLVMVGLWSYLGLQALRHQLEKVEAADALIELEQQRQRLEDLAK